MTDLTPSMHHPEKEMVPAFLVKAMFALMAGAVAIVTFAQITGRPNVGVVKDSPIVAERMIAFNQIENTFYQVLDENGAILGLSSTPKDGFIGVMGMAVYRARLVANVAPDTPIRLVRRENGAVAIIDDSIGWSAEFLGYGSDNVAAFDRLLN